MVECKACKSTDLNTYMPKFGSDQVTQEYDRNDCNHHGTITYDLELSRVD